MTKTADPDTVLSRAIAILRHRAAPMDSAHLGRVLGVSGSVVCQEVKHPNVKVTRGLGLTTFVWVP